VRESARLARGGLIAPRGDKRYIRRDARGRIKETDDVGRSLSQDQRRKAETVAKAGQGDRGDRRITGKVVRNTAKRPASGRGRR
jgi:hypothetical protein